MIDVLDCLSDTALEPHTALILTYHLDLVLYDKLIRPRLAAAGATNQVVFCDTSGYAASLDGVDSRSKIGRAYSVIPVDRRGAFHPKAYLLLGRRRGQLIVGSGNATLGGLVRNAEMFSRFDHDTDDGTPPHPAFATVFRMIEDLARDATPAVAQQIERARASSPWLAETAVTSDARALHTGGIGGSPLREVIAASVGASEIKRIVALSSSFDRRLEAVRSLAALGRGTHPTVVVVQPDRVVIDGESVRALPATVGFTAFVDPRPSKRHEPPDCYAHCKTYIVETTEADLLFIGSANLSAPALLDGANTELLVAVGPAAPGTWVARLGLTESLETDVRTTLSERQWKDENDELGDDLIHLGGVEWSPQDGWLVATKQPVPPGFSLALGKTRDLADHVRSFRASVPGLATASGPSAPEIRFAWLIDDHALRVSHVVVVTWPEVARSHRGGWPGRPSDADILAMSIGELLHPILFELLDRMHELDVLGFARTPSSDRGEQPGASVHPDAADRPPESFYTDSRRSAKPELGTDDDSTDLEILAALVQPLSVARAAVPRATNDEDDPDIGGPDHDFDYNEDDDDDGALDEEAERLALDAADARDDGSEPAPASRIPTAARMRKAGARMTKRLERAATELCRTASIIKAYVRLPPRALARQVAMTFIAAAAAEKPVETSDEGALPVVEGRALAHYVLRCGAAMGGLVTHLEPASWQTQDGKLLASGLRFVAAACAWSVAYFESQYAREPEDASGVHDAAPLFMLARLLVAAGDQLTPLDFADAAVRIASWSHVSPGATERAYGRAITLAAWISDVEHAPTQAPRGGAPIAGSMVHLNKVGVALVLAAQGDRLWVAVPARPLRALRYNVKVRGLVPPSVGRLLIANLSDLRW